jgi:hypothetical protein
MVASHYDHPWVGGVYPCRPRRRHHLGTAKCAREIRNSHGPNGPQGPQPCAVPAGPFLLPPETPISSGTMGDLDLEDSAFVVTVLSRQRTPRVFLDHSLALPPTLTAVGLLGGARPRKRSRGDQLEAARRLSG